MIVYFLLLSSLIVPEYNRYEYRWIDENKNGFNTRAEVLIEENLGKLEFEGNRVVSGLWYDPYSDKYFTNAHDLDIDHVVPLKEAHINGAYNWSSKKKKKFGNDLEFPNHLIAVDKKVNRQKGAKNICDWMPPSKKYYLEYLDNWIYIKRKYNLVISLKERICIITRKLEFYFYINKNPQQGSVEGSLDN